jgi:hypothetical protein
VLRGKRVTSKILLQYAEIAELVTCIVALALVWRKRIDLPSPLLLAFIATRAIAEAISIPMLFFHRALGIPVGVAWPVHLFTTWAAFIIQNALFVGVIFQLYRLAMKPFEGLQRMGLVVFRWVALVSVLISLSLAIGPHSSLVGYMSIAAQRVQQGLGILTLCLLLFVCFAIRPLGLTFRSKIFGISLGLGVLSSTNFVEAAWFTASGATTVYSACYIVGALGWVLAGMVWGTYFVLPEPKQRMVLLPTTSPFFLWNRVSEALGDGPGYVAVSGFRPDMLEPAELTVLTAASVAARERRVREVAIEEVARTEAAMAKAQSATFHNVAIQR